MNGRLSTILRLTVLAPNIVEAFLDGRRSPGVGRPQLMAPFLRTWHEQRSAIAGDTRASS
jgi:hypothetical protein